MGKIINMTGQKFGRLTVIKRAGRDKRKNATWLCKCDCGNETIVRSSDLRRGDTRSCGCLRRETVIASNKLWIGKKRPGCGCKKELNHFWKGGRRKSNGYVMVHQPNHPYANAKGYVFEHRLVAERILGEYLKPEHVIHHVNGVLDDNRPENLWWFPNHSAHITFHNNRR